MANATGAAVHVPAIKNGLSDGSARTGDAGSQLTWRVLRVAH
jgi:hypothetical protein